MSIPRLYFSSLASPYFLTWSHTGCKLPISLDHDPDQDFIQPRWNFDNCSDKVGKARPLGEHVDCPPLPPSAGTNQFKSAQPLALNPSVPSTQGGRTNSFNKMSSLLHCTSITVRKNLPSTQKCICTVCIFVNCHQWTTTENHLAIDNKY